MNIDISTLDRAVVLSKLYSMAAPSWTKLEKYVPGGMFVGEAIILLEEHGNKFSYVRGRSLFVDLTGPIVNFDAFLEHYPYNITKQRLERVLRDSSSSYQPWVIHVVTLIAQAMLCAMKTEGRSLAKVLTILGDDGGEAAPNKLYYEKIPSDCLSVDTQVRLLRFGEQTHVLLEKYNQEASHQVAQLVKLFAAMSTDTDKKSGD